MTRHPVARLMLLAVAGAILLSACGSASPTPSPTASPSPSPVAPSAGASQPPSAVPPAPGALPLEGTNWTLVVMGGERMPEGTGIEMLLNAGQVGGNGGCNRFGGPYTATGTDLRFGDLASTAMGCMGAINQRESFFHQALGTTRAWQVAGEELQLSDEGGNLRLVFRRTQG